MLTRKIKKNLNDPNDIISLKKKTEGKFRKLIDDIIDTFFVIY